MEKLKPKLKILLFLILQLIIIAVLIFPCTKKKVKNSYQLLDRHNDNSDNNLHISLDSTHLHPNPNPPSPINSHHSSASSFNLPSIPNSLESNDISFEDTDSEPVSSNTKKNPAESDFDDETMDPKHFHSG